MNAVLCAAGYNLRWLLRAIVRLGLGPSFVRLILVKFLAQWCVHMGERVASRFALMALAILQGRRRIKDFDSWVQLHLPGSPS